MKALLQRVKNARVSVDQEIVGEIDSGLLVFLGIDQGDTPQLAERLLDKLLAYRLFADADDKMNLSLSQTGGGLLVVSQFTLSADTRKGLRPSFSSAAAPEQSRLIYDHFLKVAGQRHQPLASGCFAANMQVELTNDGPVTFLLEMNNPPTSGS